MDPNVVRTRKRVRDQHDIENVGEDHCPALKKPAPWLLENDTLQHAASILSDANIMANIYSLVSCIESLCKLHFALGRFASAVEPCVRHLSFHFTGVSDYHFLSTHFVQKCYNLKSLKFWCDASDTTDVRYWATDPNLLTTRACLPQYVESLRLCGLPSDLTFSLLGPNGREQLSILEICHISSHDILLADDAFCYPKLTSLNLTLENYGASLQKTVAILSKNCPYLTSLSLKLSEINLLLSKDVDMTNFRYLEYVSLQPIVMVLSSHQFLLHLPPHLKTFGVSCSILNMLDTKSTPIHTLESIRFECKYDIEQCHFPVHILAPNLKRLESNCMNVTLPFITSAAYAMQNFLQLEKISGSIVAGNPFLWPYVAHASESRRDFVMTQTSQYADFNATFADSFPAFNRIRVTGDNDVMHLPDHNIAVLTHILCPYLSYEPFMRLTSMASHLKKLSIQSFCLDFTPNLKMLHSLETLEICHEIDVFGMEHLHMAKCFVQENLPPSLTKLTLAYDSYQLFEIFPQLNKYAVSDIRQASISLVQLLKSLPNLASLCMDIPVVDVDEPQMTSIDLSRLEMLKVTTFRNGQDCLDQHHLHNLQRAFSHHAVELEVCVCQPILQDTYPNSTKIFCIVPAVPSSFLKLLQARRNTKNNGHWFCEIDVHSDSTFSDILSHQAIQIYKSRGKGKLYI